jgi:uncharacterized protein (DUF302 family)
MATVGLVTVPSEFGAPETLARLDAAVNAAGMTVYARIDHGAAAGAVHLALGATELVILGNAKGGTLLMQAHQAVGIDLPLKALVYEDASGHVFVAYNDPHWIAERHGLGAEVLSTVAAMASVIKGIVVHATESHPPAPATDWAISNNART